MDSNTIMGLGVAASGLGVLVKFVVDSFVKLGNENEDWREYAKEAENARIESEEKRLNLLSKVTALELQNFEHTKRIETLEAYIADLQKRLASYENINKKPAIP